MSTTEVRATRSAIWVETASVVVALFALTAVALLGLLTTNWLVDRAISWAIYGLIVVVVVSAVRRSGRPLRSALGLERADLGRQLLVVGAVWAGLLALIVGVPLLFGASITDVVGTREGSTAAIIVAAATLVVVVGPVEELVFRGYLLGRLRDVMPTGWAVVTQAVVFGLWHFPVNQNFPQVGVATIIGLLLGMVRCRVPSATIPALAVAHGLYDVTLTVIALLA